jgi:uncharacterized damage-inducible protein DinB
MNSEIQNIIALLTSTFEKKAWHGPAVKEVLKDIMPAQALHRFENTHSIIELIAHMTSWRVFVIKKLEGEQNYTVTDEMNFPAVKDLQKAIIDLEESQSRLLAALGHFPGARLHEIVPHGSYHYSYYTLLHGIIHHDLYHLGQIAFIKKTGFQAS